MEMLNATNTYLLDNRTIFIYSMFVFCCCYLKSFGYKRGRYTPTTHIPFNISTFYATIGKMTILNIRKEFAWCNIQFSKKSCSAKNLQMMTTHKIYMHTNDCDSEASK